MVKHLFLAEDCIEIEKNLHEEFFDQTSGELFASPTLTDANQPHPLSTLSSWLFGNKGKTDPRSRTELHNTDLLIPNKLAEALLAKQTRASEGKFFHYPALYLCPLSGKFMHEPVTTLNGITYEKQALLEMWEFEHTPQEERVFVNNFFIKHIINDFLAKKPNFQKTLEERFNKLRDYLINTIKNQNKDAFSKLIEDDKELLFLCDDKQQWPIIHWLIFYYNAPLFIEFIKVFNENLMPDQRKRLIRQTSPDGSTPLHIAVQFQKKGPYLWLLENKASLLARDKNGQRPLDIYPDFSPNDVPIKVSHKFEQTPDFSFLHPFKEPLLNKKSGLTISRVLLTKMVTTEKEIDPILNYYLAKEWMPNQFAELFIKRNQENPNENYHCPEFYYCPITGKIMHDPVTTLDSITYEEEAIKFKWQQENTPEQQRIYYRNLFAKELIDDYLEQKPAARQDVYISQPCLQTFISSIQNQNIDTFSKLTAENPNLLFACFGDYKTPLIHFLIHDNYELIFKVFWASIDRNKGKVVVNQKDNSDTTPLMLAIIHGKIDLVSHLIDLGADIFAKDTFGNTALHYAYHYNQLDAIKLILASIKKIPDSTEYIEMQDQNGNTALHYAFLNGHREVIRYQLEQYPYANIKIKNCEKKSPYEVKSKLSNKTEFAQNFQSALDKNDFVCSLSRTRLVSPVIDTRCGITCEDTRVNQSAYLLKDLFTLKLITANKHIESHYRCPITGKIIVDPVVVVESPSLQINETSVKAQEGMIYEREAALVSFPQAQLISHRLAIKVIRDYLKYNPEKKFEQFFSIECLRDAVYDYNIQLVIAILTEKPSLLPECLIFFENTRFEIIKDEFLKFIKVQLSQDFICERTPNQGIQSAIKQSLGIIASRDKTEIALLFLQETLFFLDHDLTKNITLELGKFYDRKSDIKNSLYYYESAAYMGSNEATTRLINLYLDNKFDDINENRKIKFLIKAAFQQRPEAQEYLKQNETAIYEKLSTYSKESLPDIIHYFIKWYLSQNDFFNVKRWLEQAGLNNLPGKLKFELGSLCVSEQHAENMSFLSVGIPLLITAAEEGNESAKVKLQSMQAATPSNVNIAIQMTVFNYFKNKDKDTARYWLETALKSIFALRTDLSLQEKIQKLFLDNYASNQIQHYQKLDEVIQELSILVNFGNIEAFYVLENILELEPTYRIREVFQYCDKIAFQRLEQSFNESKEGLYVLGILYLNDKHNTLVQRDLAKAISYFERAEKLNCKASSEQLKLLAERCRFIDETEKKQVRGALSSTMFWKDNKVSKQIGKLTLTSILLHINDWLETANHRCQHLKNQVDNKENISTLTKIAAHRELTQLGCIILSITNLKECISKLFEEQQVEFTIEHPTKPYKITQNLRGPADIIKLMHKLTIELPQDSFLQKSVNKNLKDILSLKLLTEELNTIVTNNTAINVEKNASEKQKSSYYADAPGISR